MIFKNIIYGNNTHFKSIIFFLVIVACSCSKKTITQDDRVVNFDFQNGVTSIGRMCEKQKCGKWFSLSNNKLVSAGIYEGDFRTGKWIHYNKKTYFNIDWFALPVNDSIKMNLPKGWKVLNDSTNILHVVAQDKDLFLKNIHFVLYAFDTDKFSDNQAFKSVFLDLYGNFKNGDGILTELYSQNVRFLRWDGVFKNNESELGLSLFIIPHKNTQLALFCLSPAISENRFFLLNQIVFHTRIHEDFVFDPQMQVDSFRTITGIENTLNYLK